VATVASKHGIPHVVIPAGTRNHLALDLGLDRDDVVGALDAFTGGIPRTIDLATVNGRVFVNNASLGLYAQIVASDAYRDAKLRTTLDTLPDLLGSNADSLDLHFVDDAGQAHDTADVVLVSNNPYVLDSLGGVGTRARMDTGQLGVVSLTITSATDARRFLALETAGQARRFPGWQEWSTARFEITSSSPVRIGVDGEALTMDPPVVFEMLPAALTVLLPPQAPGRSPAARKLTGNTPRELWDLALGRG
jgi:diacylglycerol kinase family enzyme